ncbi:MAG: EamA family transporter, partial [Acidimicrobiia bacterium]|nr:EamA family transporter [Acidimicrobiia bacterium]
MLALAVFFGLMAAACIGMSDLFGRRVARASSSITAASAIQIVSGLAATLLAVTSNSVVTSESLSWGCLSGFGMAFGLSLYYSGLQRSSATLVAPIVASMTALAPYAYSVLRGSPASVLAGSGAVIAVVGLVLVTGGAVSPERMAAGIRYGAASGVAYAGATIAFIEAADGGGWWPVVGQRVVAAGVLAVLALIAGHRIWPGPGQRLNGVGGGILTMTVSISLLAGLALDPGPAS